MIKPKEFAHFETAYLKVERSKIHAAELDAQLELFLASNPYRAIIDPDTRNKTKHLLIEQIAPTPRHLPLIIGDVIHNLRSALDHLASDLVMFQEASIDNVYFPTGSDKDGFHEALKRHIRKAGPAAIQSLSKLEAYYGGDGAILRALHDLDLADKHRAIVPTVNRAMVTNIRGTSPQGHDIFFAGVNMSIHNGRGDIMGMPNYFKVEFDEAKAADVSFGEPKMLGVKTVREATKEMTEAVIAVIDTFANDPAYA